jgi:hypothetical protein
MRGCADKKTGKNQERGGLKEVPQAKSQGEQRQKNLQLLSPESV